MKQEAELKEFSIRNFQKKITKVNERIYHFLGYGHSNAIAIFGDTSILLIDTLDSVERGVVLREELAKLSDLRVETIIYTHGHPDHRGGAGAFRDTVKDVMAMRPKQSPYEHYDKLSHILNKRGKRQFGYELSDDEAITQGIGIREGAARGETFDSLPVTIWHEEDLIRCTIDGIPLEIFRAPGECDDGLAIWLPEDEVLCCGDNYYGCWPNTYAIRGTQYRDLAQWIATLRTMLSYPSKVLLPGHTRALFGEEIQEVLGSYTEALESVLMQTLECMDRGFTVSQCVEAVNLPDHLQGKEYLGEYYGTIEWTVRGIYSGYLGWFDGDPVHLMPASEEKLSLKLLSLMNEQAVLLEIENCLSQEEYQLALELGKIMSCKKDHEKQLKKLRQRALLGRAAQMTSANARHYYIACAKEEHQD